jgi:peptidoglycan-associated lipoprotein
LLAAGCVTPQKSKLSDKNKSKAAAESADAAYVPGVDVVEASLRGADFTALPDIEPIYFDYDSSNLSDPALAALKKNAAFLREHKTLQVRVAGYCDERGTIGYNLALGQKRAKEVREYYIRLGVPGNSLATISFGKEQQVCSEATESCWTKNRRAETSVRGRAATAETGTEAKSEAR